ncbi:hypothetical protein RFI_02193 [Reticulomyxa filosa]|uniref:Uncharacterized protein n=1 Tax=Reticulomyxa filosa TaxID=46433 RepID=X6PA23_RETFI|nr:hypothetical protein RFI_02193 [Reticulomyxa filosa]|eukprot:ETO34899.1 hypothetical protein RFI_02193 [Reticulomyxa filosa]
MCAARTSQSQNESWAEDVDYGSDEDVEKIKDDLDDLNLDNDIPDGQIVPAFVETYRWEVISTLDNPNKMPLTETLTISFPKKKAKQTSSKDETNGNDSDNDSENDNDSDGGNSDVDGITGQMINDYQLVNAPNSKYFSRHAYSQQEKTSAETSENGNKAEEKQEKENEVEEASPLLGTGMLM